jgi:alpha-mannosidase
LVLERAWAADLLEVKGEELSVVDGSVQVGLGPAATATFVLQLAAGPGPTGPDGGGLGAQAGQRYVEDEPARPVFSRYWLHNKGPAPMGNQALAVHLGPVAARARPGEASTELVATVSSASATTQAGSVEIAAPDGWEVSPAGRMFNLAPGAFSRLPLRAWVPEGCRPGRYFISARLTDSRGRQMEDIATVDVLPRGPLGLYGMPEGEPGTPSGDAWAPAAWAHPGSQASNELTLELSTEEFTLRPGEQAVVELRARNHCRSDIRAEVQLISPWETWADCGPWSQPLVVPALGEASVSFVAQAPLGRQPYASWLLMKVMYFGRLWYSPTVRLEVVGA